MIVDAMIKKSTLKTYQSKKQTPLLAVDLKSLRLSYHRKHGQQGLISVEEACDEKTRNRMYW
jgi:hypothetical protein